MNLDRAQYLSLAKKGAQLRLEQIAAERATLITLLRGIDAPTVEQPVKRMSLKQRKLISRKMRRYWREVRRGDHQGDL